MRPRPRWARALPALAALALLVWGRMRGPRRRQARRHPVRRGGHRGPARLPRRRGVHAGSLRPHRARPALRRRRRLPARGPLPRPRALRRRRAEDLLAPLLHLERLRSGHELRLLDPARGRRLLLPQRGRPRPRGDRRLPRLGHLRGGRRLPLRPLRSRRPPLRRHLLLRHELQGRRGRLPLRRRALRRRRPRLPLRDAPARRPGALRALRPRQRLRLGALRPPGGSAALLLPLLQLVHLRDGARQGGARPLHDRPARRHGRAGLRGRAAPHGDRAGGRRLHRRRRLPQRRLRRRDVQRRSAARTRAAETRRRSCAAPHRTPPRGPCSASPSNGRSLHRRRVFQPQRRPAGAAPSPHLRTDAPRHPAARRARLSPVPAPRGRRSGAGRRPSRCPDDGLALVPAAERWPAPTAIPSSARPWPAASSSWAGSAPARWARSTARGRRPWAATSPSRSSAATGPSTRWRRRASSARRGR